MTLPALLFGTLIVLMPLSLDEAGFGAVAIGAVWLVAAALEAVLNPVIGHASDRFGELAPVRIGLVAAIVVSLLLAVLSGPVALVVLTLAAGIAYGGFYTPSLLLLSDSAERIGLAQGLVFGLMGLAWACRQHGRAAGERGARGRAGRRAPLRARRGGLRRDARLRAPATA